MPRKKSGAFDQYEYVKDYVKTNIVYKHINFNRRNQSDLLMLEWIEAQKDEGISNYLKRLVMEDMIKNNFNGEVLTFKNKCNKMRYTPTGEEEIRRNGSMKMKYLNDHKIDLFENRKITFRGKVYWANMTTLEIYAMSIDDQISGVKNGVKVADITDDWTIVPCK